MAANEEATRPNTLFEDVFRRADKNDDGSISWDEFRAYFEDCVSTDEELHSLFHKIDTHNTNNLDVGELCEFFKKHLGPFADIFKNLDVLSSAVTRALFQCHQNYSASSATEQFSVRFLLKEVLRQFGFQQHHMELALDKIEEDENSKRPISSKIENSNKFTGRGARMFRKMHSCPPPTSFQGPSPVLEAEIDRLADLIDRLDTKIKFDVVEEEIVDGSTDEPIVLLCRKFSIESSAVDNFKAFLRSYLLDVKKNEICLGTSVRIDMNQGSFTLYEIWQNDVGLSKHLVSEPFRAFQRQAIDCLTRPEDFSSMSLPASWWCKE